MVPRTFLKVEELLDFDLEERIQIRKVRRKRGKEK